MAAARAFQEALKRLKDLGFVAPEIREERLKYIEQCLETGLKQLEIEPTTVSPSKYKEALVELARWRRSPRR